MKEYKIGEVIKIKKNKEEFNRAENDLIGAKASLVTISALQGEAIITLWNLIQREYPELYKQYELSYHKRQLKILSKKED